MAGWIAVSLAIVGVAAFIVLARRSAPKVGTYRGVAATGISPVGAIDHVEAAVRRLDGYDVERHNDHLTIRGKAAISASDTLNVRATRVDVGTRVEIWGVARPLVIAAVRDALARTPPWTNAL